MRRARRKSSTDAFYHIITRVAGSPRYLPLENRFAQKKLLDTILIYVTAYCCELAAYAIMGNHYHLILFIEEFRKLSRSELKTRAKQLYGNRTDLKTSSWSDEAWEQFNRKLFDLSALMQHINGEYAKWFNKHFDRRGHLWADRYKNPELLDQRALQECLFYVELNAVRAGLVKHPEQWRFSSSWLRWKGCDRNLMPLDRIFPETQPAKVMATYRFWLRQRGAAGSSARAPIAWPGLFLRRRRFFTDGLAIGNQPSVSKLLGEMRAQGIYRHRKKPIAQLSGFLFTLREQRSHART